MEPNLARLKEHSGPVLHLFGGPYVTLAGARHEIPEGARRLVAFVALHHRRVDRHVAAGILWPDVRDERAAGNLRSVLWRLRSAPPEVLAVDGSSVWLAENVAVDARLLADWSDRVIAGTAAEDDLSVTSLWLDGLDLLPGWFDDWMMMERERLRQRTLHALEVLSGLLAQLGRSADAIEAALAAVNADPLRESAQRALISAHLTEGNVLEAHHAFKRFRMMTRSELGVEPSLAVRALLGMGGGPALRDDRITAR